MTNICRKANRGKEKKGEEEEEEAEMAGIKRLCKKSLYTVITFTVTHPHTLTEQLADTHDAAERGAGEAGKEPERESIGQNQFQGFVLGCEAETSISVYPVLIQSPCRSQQPLLLLLPPKRMVRPVLLNLCSTAPGHYT